MSFVPVSDARPRLAPARQWRAPRRENRRRPWLRAHAAAALCAAALFVSGAAAAETTVEVYTRPGCPHCTDALEFLEKLAGERADLSIAVHDVTSDRETLDRFRDVVSRAGVATPGVPTFVIGSTVIVGFDAETTPARIRSLLAGAEAREEPPGLEPADSVDLPLVGAVDVTGLGLPLFTIAVGLIDGFNPCATWVLLFLLSMLVNLKSRPRMALIAGTFVLASGLVYFAFMAAWLTVFMAIGMSRPISIALGFVALFVGAFHLKDFVALGRGPSLRIPESAKPGFYERVRAVLHAENLAGAMLGILALAFLVNLVELLCTAGLPALYTAILTHQGLPPWQYYAYLGLYIAAYLFDDAILVTIGVATLGRRKLQERGGRWLELLSGLAISALGLLLLIRPTWLGF